MKKIIVIIITLCITITGCHILKDETGQAESQKEYKEITLFCDVDFWGTPAWNIEENNICKTISEKTGVTVRVVDNTDNPDKQISIALANDNLPDMISVTDETVISQLVTSGKVWNMEEFLNKYKPDSHLLKDFPEDIKYELKKRDGGWYAYPSHMSSPDNRKNRDISKYYLKEIEYSQGSVIMWNKVLLKQMGLDVKKLRKEKDIFEALERAGQYKTQDGKSIVPLLIEGRGYRENSLEFLAASMGAESIDKEENYTDIYFQPEMKDAMFFLNKAMRKGYITPSQLLYENRDIQSLIGDGSVLCYIGNAGNTGLDEKNWISSGAILSDTGKYPVYMQNLRRTTGWINTFISKDCREPEAIANFLDYMTSEKGQLQWVYGIRGVHYIMDDNGKLVMTEKGKKAQGDWLSSGVNVWWMFFNIDWSRSVVADPDKDSEAALQNNIGCAYALDEKTQICDGTALQFLDIEDGAEYKQIEDSVEEWKKNQGTKVILAESEAEFEKQYQILIQGLKEREIDKLIEKKNELYQKNCKEYKVFLKKVN